MALQFESVDRLCGLFCYDAYMTQKYTQKYTVVCFFDAQNAPTNFSALDWPLHVTMLDTFKTDWPLATLQQKLKTLVQATPPFDVQPTKQAMLGPNKDVAVKLLSPEGGISAFHAALMELAREGSFTFNSPEFVGEGFLPHATGQKDGHVDVGQTYRLTSASLIDMFPGGDHMQRSIVETFPFCYTL